MLRPSLSSLQPACPSLAGGLSLGLANRVLDFACSNIEYLLGELDRITRTFGHKRSMPQISGYFETETLPKIQVVLRDFAGEP